MNEELIRQIAREASRDYWMERYAATGSESAKKLADFSMEGACDAEDGVASAAQAIRLYHARHVAPLVEALRAVTPITVHNTPDYAELTFGGSQTQAMTMEPEKWEAVNSALAPFQQENSND